MDFSDLVTPVKRQTMGGDVYEQIKELLVSGRLMPGEPLSLRATAAALGVSVMPVRDAMQRLVAEQALEVTPNRAMRVPVMKVAQFREITTIRINLEGLATEMAATLIDEDALAQIGQWQDAFAAEMGKGKPDGTRLITLNKEFHFAIYRCADMPMLLQMIEALWLRIGPILNHDLRSGSRRVQDKVAVGHHAQLVKALAKRDAAAARKALRGDIETAADFIVKAGVLVEADGKRG